MDCLEVSEQCPVEDTIYGYYPSLEANAFFTALFAVCFIVNIAIGWRYKTWSYMAAMVGPSHKCINRQLSNENRVSLVRCQQQVMAAALCSTTTLTTRVASISRSAASLFLQPSTLLAFTLC